MDDGSTDNSGSMCDKYINDNRVKVFHKENGGLSDARNYGIKESKGEYISFVDSDDYVSSDYIEYLFSLIQRDSTCISSAIYTRSENSIDDFNKTDFEEWCFTSDTALKECCYGDKLRSIACSKLYIRNIFNDYSFPLNKLYEDQYIIYEIIHNSLATSVSSKMIYSYTINKDSITESSFNNKHLDLLYDALRLVDYTKDMSCDIKFAVSNRCVISIYQILRMYFKTDNDKKIFYDIRSMFINQLKLVASNPASKFKMRVKARVVLMGYLPSKVFVLYLSKRNNQL